MDEWMALQVLPLVFTWTNLAAMSMGVLFGMLVGVLPGLTATMGVALLLPATFGMGPVPALLMLLGIYKGAIYGGCVSAILLHTPGTPASAATALDGYPLAMQGKAAETISVATLCSAIGGVASGFALLLLAPPLAEFALRFGPPERFLVAIFGLTVIATLASGGLLKGLIAGLFGLLLGTVGVDVMTGFARYHFGVLALLGGVPLIPALIGLFALSQVMVLSESTHQAASQLHTKGWGIVSALSDVIGAKINLIRSSIIGVIIGILPGAGSDIASWVSYGEAKRFSKQPEKFGQSAIEGVIASETANNAATGATLIPLLTLGIPGGAVAAVILGGMMIQGLRPGRELFTVHAETTYTIMVGFIVANILMGIIGLLIMPRLAFITRIPASTVAPIVVALCVIGSFAMRNHLSDVWIMLFFGILGYFMRKAGFPPAAVVLGLILGPIAELGFRQSLVLGGEGLDLMSYFFGRPICVVLMILIIGSLLLPFILKKKVRPSD